MQYGGRSGAEENAHRDAAFASMSPEERCLALGMDPHASAGELRYGDYITLELNESDGWRNPSDEELYQLIGGSYNRELTASTRSTGRGSNFDDYTRELDGLKPRTRWDPDTLSPQTLNTIGKKPAGNHSFQRELVGDGIDAMDFGRALANKAGFGANWGNRANWQINGNGGIVTFKGSDSFQVSFRGSANSNSGVAAIEVKWNNVPVKWHVVDK